MTNSIIFKGFQTKRKNYIYDRHTNSIFSVKDDEYEELRMVHTGQLSEDESQVIQNYRKKYGVFQKNVVQQIKHPATDYMEHLLRHRMHHLILQVTQQCNLRCGYCIFGGGYKHARTHSAKRMDFATAKKAIDFFLEHSSERGDLHIGFYGGEPLLEFDLMKQCVHYAEAAVEGKTIHFGMTTNGTLLTPEVTQFLDDHDFHFSISLDGSKEEHDANRKFRSGQGSFDLIMDNVRRIRRNHPRLNANISFMTTINPKADLCCVMEFFSTDTVFSDSRIVFNSVDQKDIKEKSQYSESFFLLRKYEYLKVLFMHIGKIKSDCISPMALDSTVGRADMYRRLGEHSILQPICHPGGPCLPGIKRLFVNTSGRLYPCEKVNENLDYFCIGSLDTGVDLEQAKELINCGKVTEEECKQCWNLPNCKICSNQVDFGEEKTLCAKDKMIQCKKDQNRVLSDLREICVLREFGYTAPQVGLGYLDEI